MTRTRRTTALIAAAALALGVTACSPPNEKESDNTTVVTEVTPDPGYEGAGKATTSGEAEADDEAEASSIAKRIKEMVDAGQDPRSVAILLRTNGQTEAYERALSSAGLSYQLRGGERFFC